MNEKILEKALDNPDAVVKLFDLIGGIKGLIVLGSFFLIVYIIIKFINRGLESLINIIKSHRKEIEIKQAEKEKREIEKQKIENKKKELELQDKYYILMEKAVFNSEKDRQSFHLAMEKLGIYPSIERLSKMICSYTGTDKGLIIILKGQILSYIEPLELGFTSHKDYNELYTTAKSLINIKIIDKLKQDFLSNTEALISIEKDCTQILDFFLSQIWEDYIKVKRFRELRLLLDAQEEEREGLNFIGYQLNDAIISQYSFRVKNDDKLNYLLK